MNKALTKLLKFLGVIILLMIVALIAIPYFYKDEIMSYVKKDINQQLNATLDFSDLSLSLFKSFPDMSCSLSDFSIMGKGDFEGLPLVKSTLTRVDLDLMSIIKSDRDIQIHELVFTDPEVNIKILADGTANYDIYEAEPSTASNSSSTTDFLANLDAYEIINGEMSYNDFSSGSEVLVVGLNHQGQGTFSADQFDLNTSTSIEELSVGKPGMKFLNRDRLNADLKIGVDLAQGVYTLKQNDIELNALKLIAEGDITVVGEGYDLDLKIAAPGSEFKEVLSILPGAYSKDFNKVAASGSFRLVGTVKGIYDSSKSLLPTIGFNLDISDGAFGYPGMADGFKSIFANAIIAGDLNKMDEFIIDIGQLNFNLGNEPFGSNLFLTNFETNPKFKGAIKGRIDLAQISSVMPLDGVQEFSGIFDADINAEGDYNQVQFGAVDELGFGGTASIDNFVYDAEGLPKFKINTADLSLTPKQLELSSFDASYGKSGFKGDLSVKNFLAILLPSKTMSGTFSLVSENLDLNDLLNFEEEYITSSAETEAVASETAPFDRFDFNGTAVIKQMQYDVYPIRDFKFKGRVRSNNLNIEACQGKLGKTDFEADGQLDNMFNYLYEGQSLTGVLNLKSNVVDLNEFMTFGEAAEAKAINSEEEYEPVQIPERINLDINAKVNKVFYSDLDLKNAKGKIRIAEQVANLDNVSMNTLGGKMIFDGDYNTQDAEQPVFDLNYKMEKVSFDAVFKKLNTFKIFAPIGQYLQGTFDTDMSFKGALDKDLSPLFDQLTADGFMQTFNGTLKSFPPLEKIGEQLNLEYFKSIPIQNTKNWFEIKEGKLIVKEFKQSIEGIDMLIGGSHGLNQDMDYTIKAKVPRSKFKGQLAGHLDKGIGLITGQAKKLGIDIDQSEFINLGIQLMGSIKNPKVKLTVLGVDGNSSLKDAVVNTVKEEVKEKVDSVKTVVTDKVDEEKKALKQKMDKEVDAVMALAKKQADAARAAGKKAAEEAKKFGYAQADKLVKDAGNSIFKKKAAELAANKLKKETDKKCNKLVSEANKKADGIMAKANQKVTQIKNRYGEL